MFLVTEENHRRAAGRCRAAPAGGLVRCGRGWVCWVWYGTPHFWGLRLDWLPHLGTVAGRARVHFRLSCFPVPICLFCCVFSLARMLLWRKPFRQVWELGAVCPIVASVAAGIGELVQSTSGKWMVRAPERCLNGHSLAPNQVLVGHVACNSGHGGGHTTWRCCTCDAVVYGPPLGAHCTVLVGPTKG